MLGHGGSRRGRAIGVDVFPVDVLGAGVKGAAVRSAGVPLFESVEFEFWRLVSRIIVNMMAYLIEVSRRDPCFLCLTCRILARWFADVSGLPASRGELRRDLEGRVIEKE